MNVVHTVPVDPLRLVIVMSAVPWRGVGPMHILPVQEHHNVRIVLHGFFMALDSRRPDRRDWDDVQSADLFVVCLTRHERNTAKSMRLAQRGRWAAVVLSAILCGCVAQIDAISKDSVVVIQDGVPDGDVLIKAREACALYGRVPVYVGVVVPDGIVLPIRARRHQFACVDSSAGEASLAEGAIARRWYENAQRQAAAKQAKAKGKD